MTHDLDPFGFRENRRFGRFGVGLTKGFGFDLGHALDRAGTYASWGNRSAKKLQKGTLVLATKN